MSVVKIAVLFSWVVTSIASVANASPEIFAQTLDTGALDYCATARCNANVKVPFDGAAIAACFRSVDTTCSASAEKAAWDGCIARGGNPRSGIDTLVSNNVDFAVYPPVCWGVVRSCVTCF